MIAENGAGQRVNLTDKVSLDFSGLFSQKKEAPESPVEPISQGGQYETPSQKEKPVTGQIEGLDGLGTFKLVKKAVDSKNAREEALRICREHQENTAKSQHLQSDILKGLKSGEDIYSLFLKATEAISLMANNSLFHSQAEKDLVAIYGIGLQEKPPLSVELEQVQKRLQRLTEAEGRETDPDNRERIRRAITAHRGREKEIEALLKKA